MTDEELKRKAGSYLQELCGRIHSRSVGSEGNREATGLFTDKMRSFGFEVDCPEFDCMDWTQQGASLSVSGESGRGAGQSLLAGRPLRSAACSRLIAGRAGSLSMRGIASFSCAETWHTSN